MRIKAEPMQTTQTLDALSPKEVATRVREVGNAKANLNLASMFALAILAGVFIGLGAEFYTLVVTGITIDYGLAKLVGGAAFSLGLVLVVVAGAELFTGNNLLTLSWLSGTTPFRKVLRNWSTVFLGNLAGSLALAALMFLARQWMASDYDVGATALRIAAGKVSLDFGTALVRGILCNLLVCLAVWLCFSARSVGDKILAILFPITAFVASGFEHSVANMYFVPIGLMVKGQPQVVAASGLGAEALARISIGGFLANLIPVTIGNLIGGGIMVGLMYWFIYMRQERTKQPAMQSASPPQLRLLAPPEAELRLPAGVTNPGTPLCSYVISSGDMFYTEANQRVLYVGTDPVGGFRLWGMIPGLEATAAANLSQVLLEFGMTCDTSGNLLQAYRAMDTFGKRLGEQLAVKIIEFTPAKPAASRAVVALQCVFESMQVSFGIQHEHGKVSYMLEHCPLCKESERIGIRQVQLAHHGLNALIQSQLEAFDPRIEVRIPDGNQSDHVFSVVTSLGSPPLAA